MGLDKIDMVFFLQIFAAFEMPVGPRYSSCPKTGNLLREKVVALVNPLFGYSKEKRRQYALPEHWHR